MLKKYTLRGILILAAVIAGFIFLLRGCLSRYDERSAIAPALYFEKNDRGIVFTIIKYGKAVSYKSDGGSTYKRLNTNYFIQANDAETGEVIANKKIKHHSDIKFHPVTVMGTGNGMAWVFIGGLMAFDPFTLEKIADREIIETKNPQLKDKLPEQQSYYVYNNQTNEILITATDGLQYLLSAASLMATATDEDYIDESSVELKMKALKKKQANLDKTYQLYYDRYRAFNKLYSEKKISYAAYLDSGKNFNRQQDSISEMKKNISNEISGLQSNIHDERDRLRQVENLQRNNTSFTAMCTGVDTFNGKWYGLLSNAGLEKPGTRFRYRPVYTKAARNKLYGAAISVKDASKKYAELLIAEPEKIHDAVYLQGGFLLNKKKALPIHLENDDGFIVCYREKVGKDANIILARVDLDGNTKWAFNTMLKEFADWIYTGKRLIILGNDNKEISRSDANLLITIDLQNGKAVKHDYFTNTMRKE